MSVEAIGHRRGARITGRAIVLALVVVGLLVSAAYPVRTFLNQRSEIAGLERQARVLEDANARLAHRIRELKNPSFIEKWARECLGMVRPGEIAFLILDRRGAAPPAC